MPLLVRIWKGPLKWLGNLAIVGGIVGVRRTISASVPRKLKENTNAMSRPDDSALHLPRARHALADGADLQLLSADRARVLFAASVLDRAGAGRRPDFALLASVRRASVSCGRVWMHAVWRRDMAITGVDKRWLEHTKEYADESR